MTREQLIQKITSRKFWVAVTAFLVPILVAFNVADLTIEQVTAILAGVGGLVAYIFGEAYVDGQRVKGDTDER